MAEVIPFTRRRAAAPVPAEPAPATMTFFFDLASPEAYLLAERVERRAGDVEWRPAILWQGPAQDGGEVGHAMAAAERRARELRMPLVWPERFPARVPTAMRAATYAAERGCGGAFAVAAGRLAFCGGFDIEDPDILAEAAAAAGLEVAEALAAARDEHRDELIATAGRSLWGTGGYQLPALRVEERLYCGERSITAVLPRIGAVPLSPFAS